MNEVTHCKYMTVIIAKLNTTWAGSLALCTSMQASSRPKHAHTLWFLEPGDLVQSQLRSIMNKSINTHTQVT